MKTSGAERWKASAVAKVLLLLALQGALHCPAAAEVTCPVGRQVGSRAADWAELVRTPCKSGCCVRELAQLAASTATACCNYKCVEQPAECPAPVPGESQVCRATEDKMCCSYDGDEYKHCNMKCPIEVGTKPETVACIGACCVPNGKGGARCNAYPEECEGDQNRNVRCMPVNGETKCCLNVEATAVKAVPLDELCPAPKPECPANMGTEPDMLPCGAGECCVPDGVGRAKCGTGDECQPIDDQTAACHPTEELKCCLNDKGTGVEAVARTAQCPAGAWTIGSCPVGDGTGLPEPCIKDCCLYNAAATEDSDKYHCAEKAACDKLASKYHMCRAAPGAFCCAGEGGFQPCGRPRCPDGDAADGRPVGLVDCASGCCTFDGRRAFTCASRGDLCPGTQDGRQTCTAPAGGQCCDDGVRGFRRGGRDGCQRPDPPATPAPTATTSAQTLTCPGQREGKADIECKDERSTKLDACNKKMDYCAKSDGVVGAEVGEECDEAWAKCANGSTAAAASLALIAATALLLHTHTH